MAADRNSYAGKSLKPLALVLKRKKQPINYEENSKKTNKVKMDERERELRLLFLFRVTKEVIFVLF